MEINTDMIKIAIVDDKQLNAKSIKEEFSRFPQIKVLYICQNGEEFLEKLRQTNQDKFPEIVLMDIDMPEKNGIDTVRTAKAAYPQIEFLMFTVFDEDAKIFEAVKAGASGYILKDESIENIIYFIQQVKEFRAVPMSPAIARKALRLLCNSKPIGNNNTQLETELTQRETEVLKCLVDGLEYKQIADKLGISPFTVRNQVSSIYQKLHVKGKVDAVKVALKNRLV